METSLVVPVEEADQLVGRWRAHLDPWARRGVAAHMTVAAPFLPMVEISAAVRRRLEAVAATQEAPEVVFDRVAHLPGAVSLLPTDDRELIALTCALVESWPDVRNALRTGRARPYHLTAACTDDRALFDEIAAVVRGQLPICARLRDVHLIAHDTRGARTVAQFRLGS